MRLDLGVNTLVGPGDQSMAFFDVGVNAAVASGPVGVLAEQTDAARNEDFQGAAPCMYVRWEMLNIHTGSHCT